jgi:hypothetical protein
VVYLFKLAGAWAELAQSLEKASQALGKKYQNDQE